MPDGRVKHIHVVAHATRNETGRRRLRGSGDGRSLSQKRGRRNSDSNSRQAEREQPRASGCARRRKMEAVGRARRRHRTRFQIMFWPAVFRLRREMIFEGNTRGLPASRRYAKNVLTRRELAGRGRWVEQNPRGFSRSQLGKRVPVAIRHACPWPRRSRLAARLSCPPKHRSRIGGAPVFALSIVIGDATQVCTRGGDERMQQPDPSQ